jgi:hypothetical protein
LPPGPKPASGFTRGGLTAGHEAPSPGDKARDTGAPAVSTPVPKRLFYTNSAKDSARQHMQLVHDHIASSFPGLCPMGNSSAPEPAGGTVKTSINMQTQLLDAGQLAARVREQVQTEALKYNLRNQRPRKTKGALTAEVMKTMLADAAQSIRADVTSVIKEYEDRLENQDAELADLRQQLDEVGSQPDPFAAPPRGAIMKDVTGGAGGNPERRSGVEKMADSRQEEKLQFLKGLTSSGDPVLREQARDQIRRLLTAP